MTTATAGDDARPAAATTWVDRVFASVPLATLFVWACLLYAWQAWLVGTPFIFTDELEFTQLARSIAEAGEPARRGVPYWSISLSDLLMAPAWLLNDVHSAYNTAKYLNVIAMSAAVFPTYALARLVVGPWPALFAAAGAVAIPGFVYSALLLEEPLAYTVAALALFLIVKALATGSRWWIAAAVAASLVAPLARSELAVIPAVFASCGLVYAWRSERAREWRERWTTWDWVGAATLGVGALLFVSALLGHLSFSWLVATGYYPRRMVEYGIWAGGAFAIGLGVLPVLAGLTALGRPHDEPRTPERTAFATVLAASIVGFGLYTAVKASYISTVFSTLVVERNLIYLAPLLFVGTAMWLERPRFRPGVLALAFLVTAVLVLRTQLKLDFPYFEAPGFAILAEANRSFEWSQPALESLRWVLLGVALALMLLPLALRRWRWAATGAVVAAALLVLAWNVAGQASASAGSRNNADLLLRGFPNPEDWLDRATRGEPALFLGQRVADPNGIHLLEFWNRSLKEVWSLDGTAPGPGPTKTPDLAETNGALSPDPGYRWVVADAGLDLVGKAVLQLGGWKLWHVAPPLRLQQSVTGIFSDGWMSDGSAYNRYSTLGDRPGTVLVDISRKGWGGTDVPGRVTIKVGPLVIGDDKQPALGEVTASRYWTVHSSGERTFPIPTPPPPFRVEVTIDPTFVPAELDPRLSDRRRLGARVSYRFVPSA